MHRMFLLSALLAMTLTPMFLEGQIHDSEGEGAKVSYARQVRPIFQAHCFGCHQPAKRGGDYLMTDFAQLIAGGESGEPAIEPGDPDGSYLVDMITPEDGTAEMPLDRPALASDQIAIIRTWIAEGAENDAVGQTLFDAEHPPTYVRPPVITSIDASPDGQWIAVNGIQEVLLIDARSRTVAKRLVGNAPRIESIRFSPDSARLAIAGGTPGEFGELQIWNVKSGSLEHSISVTGDCLFGISWSPDNRLVAFGATDNTVRAVEAATGKQVLFQNVAEDWIRDTVFSADGSHLVSVGRDMTCKLTEVATERFVDNITSITPGVLKGGISSVARHPLRDEIVVGTADGRPRLYRIFRETKRVIGDDANLIRQFPEMVGRVQAVAISMDGKRIAATSSIDGKCEVRVFSYEFDTTIPDDIKAINSKVVTQRSAEETQRLEAFVSSDIIEICHHDATDTANYALCFSADGAQLLTGGLDGSIHVIEVATGTPQDPINPFEILPVKDSANVTFSTLPRAKVAANPSGSAERAGAAVDRLEVTPAVISFTMPTDYVQLVARLVYADGVQRDVTAWSEIDNPTNSVSVSGDRIVEPTGEPGQGELTVRFGEFAVKVPVHNVPSTAFQSDFIRDVNPILGKLGCNGGTCHGSQNGKRGFKLSLRGYDPIFDIRALTDELASRRVNIADPDRSLMLAKISGRVPHEGGVLAPEDSKYYQIIRNWIAAGARLELGVPRVTGLTAEPALPVLADAEEQQQMRVYATYTDGSRRDVTRECFLEVANQEIASVTPTGLVTARRRGETAVLARYEGAFSATTLTVMGARPGFEWSDPPANNEIDRLVAQKWERMKILPSGLCTDHEFIRRVYLDLTGLPPSPSAVDSFVTDDRPTAEKRNALIDELIASPQFVDHWTNKWSDLLQVNEKFLGAEGAKLFHAWIRTQVAENVPYDQFVRSIITASGSNREHAEAAYFKILRTPEAVMENTTHLFLATRFNCNKCHDHPFERWTQDQYYETAAFFAQVGLQQDPESGDRRIGGTAVESATPLFEIVDDLDSGEMIHERTRAVTAPVFPFEAAVKPDAQAPRREQFAEWLTAHENPYFASSYANRIWSYLLGTGLVEPIDDIRASNPPTNPQLLEYLTKSFVESGFDTRALIRLICQSRTYQLAAETNAFNEDDRLNYSHAIPRRLPAEVLFDSMYFVTGSKTHFPGVPAGTWAAQLPDAGARLPSGLLSTLGKPSRESACECERSNDLHLGSVLAMVSGPDQADAINDPGNAVARLVAEVSDNRSLVSQLYLQVLNRPASEEEINLALPAFDEILDDHRQLVTQRDERQALVGPDFEQRESQRQSALESTQNELSAYLVAHDPGLLERESTREKRIKDLTAAIQEFESHLDDEVQSFRAAHLSTIQWHPLFPVEASQSNGAALKILRDRSVQALENRGKTTTSVIAVTDLARVSAIRLEALSADDLPGRGPGIAENGNFVINEFIVEMADEKDPERWTRIPLTRPAADFSQENYQIAKAIDGKEEVTGWAIVPQTGKTHWATFQFETPVAPTPGIRFRFLLIQNHADNRHQIGRFRISFSPSAERVGVSVSEELLARLVESPESWSDETKNEIHELVRTQGGGILRLRDELAAANVPIPVAPEIQSLRDRVKQLSIVTPTDPVLARLQRDVEFSERQLESSRLTVAQDLTWALINSPAFLFNH